MYRCIGSLPGRTMERESLAGALQRRWWIVVVAGIIGAVLGAAPSPKNTADSAASSFEATHTLLIDSTDPNGQIGSDTISLNQIVLLTKTGDVPRIVAERIGYSSNPASLAAEIAVNLDPSSNSLQISTTQATPEQAVLIADTFADVLTEFLATEQDDLREQRLAASLTRLNALEDQITELSDQLKNN